MAHVCTSIPLGFDVPLTDNHQTIEIPKMEKKPINSDESVDVDPELLEKQLLRYIMIRSFVKVLFTGLFVLGIIGFLMHYSTLAMIVDKVGQAREDSMEDLYSIPSNCRGFKNWAFDDNLLAITKAVLEHKEGPLIEGKFMEVGQFEDGQSLTLGLEIGFQWQGILMGPNPWAMDDLDGPQRTAMRVHGCISTGKTHDLMPLTFDADRQIVRNRAVTNGGQLTRVFVPCFPLMEVLKRAEGFQKLDLLYLGTGITAEPLDKIVESLKFDAISIQVIAIVETKNANKRAKNATDRAYNILKTHGYDMAENIGDTVIFAKKLPSNW